MNTKYALSTLMLLLVSSLALGGVAIVLSVEVDLEGGIATGQIGNARYSDNDVEYIGCGTRNNDDGAGGVSGFAFCQAGDLEGDQVVCVTTNPGLIERMESISAFSFVTFQWNEDFDCIRMGYSTQSLLLPEGLPHPGSGHGNGNNKR